MARRRNFNSLVFRLLAAETTAIKLSHAQHVSTVKTQKLLTGESLAIVNYFPQCDRKNLALAFLLEQRSHPTYGPSTAHTTLFSFVMTSRFNAPFICSTMFIGFYAKLKKTDSGAIKLGRVFFTRDADG